MTGVQTCALPISQTLPLTVLSLDNKNKINKINKINIPNNNTDQDLDKTQKNLLKYDGRFTIGADSKNITFGYPYHYTTSHFILDVGGKLASNYDHLNPNSHYLRGVLNSPASKGSPKTEVIYEFEGLTITQKLSPVDKQFQDTKAGGFGQYYWLEYTFDNKNKITKEISFALMLDLMANADEEGIIRSDAKKIPLNTRLSLAQIPEKISIASETDLNAANEIVLGLGKATKPNEVFVGTWQHLYNEGYSLRPQTTVYTNDCAMHLKWRKISLEASKTQVLGLYIGNPSAKKISVLHHQKKPALHENVFFAINKTDLDKNAIHALSKILKYPKYTYIVVEGFTDSSGNASENFILSQNRVQTVKDYLIASGVEEKKILIKSHGQHFAGKTDASQERRASIAVYE